MTPRAAGVGDKAGDRSCQRSWIIALQCLSIDIVGAVTPRRNHFRYSGGGAGHRCILAGFSSVSYRTRGVRSMQFHDMRILCVGLLIGSILHSSTAQSQSNSQRPPTKSVVIEGTVLDQTGNAVADVPVQIHYRLGLDEPATTRSDKFGRFRLAVNQTSDFIASGCFIQVEEGATGALAPLGELKEGRFQLIEQHLELRLVPLLKNTITVVDQNQKPLEQASVSISCGAFQVHILKTTDKNGQVQLRMPQAFSPTQIIAWKDGEGLSHQSLTSLFTPNSSEPTAAERQKMLNPTLVLSGSRSVKVRIVDTFGKPMVNATVRPWLLNPSDLPRSLNLSLLGQRLGKKTDSRGIATFDWIPNWQTDRVVFWSGPKGYTDERVLISPRGALEPTGGHGTIKISKLVPLRGRVVTDDGNPVANALVRISGELEERFFCDLSTDEHGVYRADVPPLMSYLLTASLSENDQVQMVSETRAGFTVRPNTPYSVEDLVLHNPTVVSGVLRDEKGEPIPDANLIVYHFGVPYKQIPLNKRLGLPPVRSYARPTLFYHLKTDLTGRYEIRLGAGDYDFRPPGEPIAHELTVKNEDRLELNLGIKKDTRVLSSFTGTVVDEQGETVEGAAIEALTRSYSDRWNAVSDRDGEFRVQTQPMDRNLFARSQDGRLAGTTTATRGMRSAKVVLHPVASIGMTVVDASGNPVPNHTVKFDMVTFASGGGRFSLKPIAALTSDAAGRLTCENLIPGALYRFVDASGSGTRPRRLLQHLRVRPGESYKGTISLSGASRLQQIRGSLKVSTKNLLERIRRVSESPIEAYEFLLEQTQLTSQKLLLVIGSSTGTELEDWGNLVSKDASIRALIADYIVFPLMIDSNVNGVGEIMERLNVSPTSFDGVSLLMVDSQGRRLAKASSSEIIDHEGISTGALKGFLKQHPIAAPDFAKHIDHVMDTAAETGKKVILVETNQGRTNAQHLLQFLWLHPDWKKDYLVARVDARWRGTGSMLSPWKQTSIRFSPICVILDQSGEKLESSINFRDDCIFSFPRTASEFEHFARMLESTSTHLNANEIDALVNAMNDYCDD